MADIHNTADYKSIRRYYGLNMNYKLIALDLDDTLLAKDLTISAKNIEAMRLASSLGVQVVFCSGRAAVSVLKFTQGLDFIHHIISYNGAMATDIRSGEKLIEYRVDTETAARLIDIGRQYGVPPQIYTDDGMLVERYNLRARFYEHNALYRAVVVKDLKEHIANGSIKVLYNARSGLLKPVETLTAGIYGEKLDIFYSKPYFLELVNIASNKGKTLCALGERLGIPPQEIIAMGDSFNDLSMITLAGLGVAMANGHPDVQRRADYVSQNDNNHSAVAEVIEKFILER